MVNKKSLNERNKVLNTREQLLEERVRKLRNEAKKRIALEIEETQKRKPSKQEVNRIYEHRLKRFEVDLERSNKGMATGGPAVGGKKKMN